MVYERRVILYPIVPKLAHILEPPRPNMLPQFESEARRRVALVTHVNSRVQSHATLHEQENLLALPGFRNSTAVHQLEHVGLKKGKIESNRIEKRERMKE